MFEAENADTCLQLQENLSCDLYLLDISMPGMNGWALCEELRKRDIDAPIFMVSANARETDHSDQIGSLHDHYFSKPIQLDHLLEKMGFAMHLDWITKDNEREISGINKSAATLDSHLIKELQTLAEIGYMSALSDKLDTIESKQIIDATLLEELRELVSSCNFRKFITRLDKLKDEQQQQPN